MIYNQEDFPFSKDGIIPDIIINPHAIPSRMTIGQILECILGKTCVFNGNSFGDATPFTDLKVDDISNILGEYNIEKYGNEMLYNPRTGEQINTPIFIGPTYYQRLKHMVQDKSHSRSSNGPIVMLTRREECLKVNTKYWLVYGYVSYTSKLRERPVLNSKLLNYVRNYIVACVNHIRYSKKVWIGIIRSQAPKFQRTRNMEKVQRLNRCGYENFVRVR
jgi:hypothetical protein